MAWLGHSDAHGSQEQDILQKYAGELYGWLIQLRSYFPLEILERTPLTCTWKLQTIIVQVAS